MVVDPNSGEHELGADAPTRELTPPRAPARELAAVPAASSGDHCSHCGAPMTHDQRYCVACGERRGQSTLPQPETVTEVRRARVRAAPAPRPPRVSSGTTMVAFVGVLLLAIGLGVLIGRIGHSSSSPKSAAGTQVISVQEPTGGGAAAATPTVSTPTNTTPAAHVTKKAQSKLNAAAKASAPPPAAVQKKATQAASKVLGNGNNLAPPTVTTGGSCSSGQAGCSNGKFDGNFFGGG